MGRWAVGCCVSQIEFKLAEKCATPPTVIPPPHHLKPSQHYFFCFRTAPNCQYTKTRQVMTCQACLLLTVPPPLSRPSLFLCLRRHLPHVPTCVRIHTYIYIYAVPFVSFPYFLFPQDPKPNSFFGSTLGAVIESYYRSGLNSWLNAKLTGKPPASMFPMFHIQIPTRVVYINGFKVNSSVHAKYVRLREKIAKPVVCGAGFFGGPDGG